jgi:hypothetical protein
MMATDERRQRAAGHVRYWLTHNTFRMGEHDLGVLRECIDALEGSPVISEPDGVDIVTPPPTAT